LNIPSDFEGNLVVNISAQTEGPAQGKPYTKAEHEKSKNILQNIVPRHTFDPPKPEVHEPLEVTSLDRHCHEKSVAQNDRPKMHVGPTATDQLIEQLEKGSLGRFKAIRRDVSQQTPAYTENAEFNGKEDAVLPRQPYTERAHLHNHGPPKQPVPQDPNLDDLPIENRYNIYKKSLGLKPKKGIAMRRDPPKRTRSSAPESPVARATSPAPPGFSSLHKPQPPPAQTGRKVSEIDGREIRYNPKNGKFFIV
jgi:hypothetical protein